MSGIFTFGSAIRLGRLLAPALVAFAPAVLAHGYRAGDVRIEHPFATPATAGTGRVYLKSLRNTGEQTDRLLGAVTPVAAHVELHAARPDATAGMPVVPYISLEPGAELKMRPGVGAELQLHGLNRPLNEGDTFAMTLQFERGGKVEVKVYVQSPR